MQKCCTHKIAFKIISEMLKQPNFIYNQPSTLPKESLAKFYLSMISGLSFMISSVAPTRSLTSYAYLVTKIGNRNLNVLRTLTFLLSSILMDRWWHACKSAFCCCIYLWRILCHRRNYPSESGDSIMQVLGQPLALGPLCLSVY